MPDSGTWLNGGQGWDSRTDERHSSWNLGPPSVNETYMQPQAADYRSHHPDSVVMMPGPYPLDHMHSGRTPAADQIHVAPNFTVLPLPQPLLSSELTPGPYMTASGSQSMLALPSMQLPHTMSSDTGALAPWTYGPGHALSTYGPYNTGNDSCAAPLPQQMVAGTTQYPGCMAQSNLTSGTSSEIVASRPQAHKGGEQAMVPAPATLKFETIKTTPEYTMGRYKRSRSKFSPVSRAKVNQVRKTGACVRCGHYKVACDDETPCSRCQELGNASLSRWPKCVRSQLENAQVFRCGDGDNGVITPTLPRLNWVKPLKVRSGRHASSGPPRVIGDASNFMTVEVTWPFSADIAVEVPSFQIDLQKFVPGGEPVAEEWTPPDGSETIMINFPPLACHNIAIAGDRILKYLQSCQGLLERQISRMIMTDPITSMAWNEVLRVRDKFLDQGGEREILAHAVRTFAAAYMNTRYPKSVRANIFNVAEYGEPPFFFDGNLLPPQLTYQIQMMIANIQMRIQDRVLSRLKALERGSGKQENWHLIFLIHFVLLSSIELMHRNQNDFLLIKKGNSESSRANVSFTSKYMLDQWDESADNLIYHYRSVTRGFYMFTQKGRELKGTTKKARLDEAALEFVTKMRDEVGGRMLELACAKESRTTEPQRRDLWAISQLFLPDTLQFRMSGDK